MCRPVEEYIKLRRAILEHLYAAFKKDPLYSDVELELLEERCASTTEELNWNIRYLQMGDFVEFDGTIGCAPRVANTAAITFSGISLVENENEFNRRFPLVKIDQAFTIYGDHVGPIQGQGTIYGSVQVAHTFIDALTNAVSNGPDVAAHERPTLLAKIKELTSHPAIVAILSRLLGG